MPFVNEIMREVFETDRRKITVSPPTGNRHFSVSKGVAYIGFVELSKEKIYREVCQECDRLVREMRPKLAETMLKAATDWRWESIKIWVDTWRDDPTCTCLSDMSMLDHDLPSAPNTWNEVVYRELHSCILDNLQPKIEDYLQDKTSQMFPDAGEFSFKLNSEDLSQVICDYPTMHFSYDLFRSDSFIGKLRQRAQNIPIFSVTATIDYSGKKVVAQNVRDNAEQFRSAIRAQSTFLDSLVDTAVDTITKKLHKQLEAYTAEMDDFFIREEFRDIGSRILR